MSDLVRRLRAGARLHAAPEFPVERMTEWEAADEIERLEAKVKSLEWARDQAVQAWEVNTEENDRLRAALERIAAESPDKDPHGVGSCYWCDHDDPEHYEDCPVLVAQEALNDE